MRVLVLEGGGMRGVYTAGVLEALAESGLRFSDVVAVSAGACAAASFLAGQAERSRRIYLDRLDGRKLVDFRRFLLGGNVMDIDYLAQDVTLSLDPLDLDALRASPTRLHIGVTDWMTGESRYFQVDGSRTDEELVALFKATCALPLFYRGKVAFEGRRYLDGGVSDPVPVEKALAIGGDDVLVVLTSPIEERGRKPMPRASSFFFSSSPAVRRALRDRYLDYRRAAKLLASPPDGVRLRVIRPSRPLPVKRTTTERGRLEEGCDLGYEDGRCFVEGLAPELASSAAKPAET